jgi:hypothetical protein
MASQTNLPAKQIQDSAARSKLFFDTYGEQPLEFNAVDVDAAIGFFTSRGFEKDSAQTVALTLLKQAKLENLNIFEILDGLKNVDNTDINVLVSEVLNNNRPSTSTLGYRKQISTVSKQRNVIA